MTDRDPGAFGDLLSGVERLPAEQGLLDLVEQL
jgi:hypothetical protein